MGNLNLKDKGGGALESNDNNMSNQRQTLAIHHHMANGSLVLVQRAKQLFCFPCLQLVIGCTGELEGGSHEVYVFLHKLKLSQGGTRAQEGWGCTPTTVKGEISNQSFRGGGEGRGKGQDKVAKGEKGQEGLG